MFEIAGCKQIGDAERITLGTRVLGLVPMPVHCYRIGSTLVDAGPSKGTAELASLVDPASIDHVVLTHHHEDHVGGAAMLQEAGATVHAPEPSLELLSEGFQIEPYQHRVWGEADRIDAEPLGTKLSTPDCTLEVHGVPGHCPDHVALLDPDRQVLFAGDAYLPPRDTLRADEDLPGFLESLETMRELDADRLLSGHGSVVDEPGEAIDEVLQHFQELAHRARRLEDEGRGPTAIRRELVGWEGFIYYYTGGHYAKQNLVDELLRVEA